ncbi:MAG TPA: hypothetical protein VGQ44_05460 [Gemmatimonadaceae bacterium]|jgi:hypothetical protein|nr:hypothetical protein [Gemmatimonadaceae bacterium]
MVAAFLACVSNDEMDREAWQDARRLGRHLFIEERVLHVGMVLGASLAAGNAVMGGTFAEYNPTRIALEAVYYLSGSMVLSGFAAMLEWRFLSKRFGSLIPTRPGARGVGRNRV